MEVPRRTRMGRLPSNEARAWERAQVGRWMHMEEDSGITSGLWVNKQGTNRDRVWWRGKRCCSRSIPCCRSVWLRVFLSGSRKDL